MFRRDVGAITFYFGKPGKGNKFKGGSGLSHIIAKHGIEVLPRMVRTIAEGQVKMLKTKFGPRAIIEHISGNQRTRAIVNLVRNSNRESWVVTSYAVGNKILTDRPLNLQKLKGPLFFVN